MTEKTNIDPIIELANNIPEINFSDDNDNDSWVDDFLDDLGLDF